MKRTPRSSHAHDRHRHGRPFLWAARFVALCVVLQAASPGFISACERAASGGEHLCGTCRAESVPAPSCHGQASDAAPTAPKPCCFLSADNEEAREAAAEITLSASAAGSTELEPVAGSADALLAAVRPFEFPPGAAAAPSPPGFSRLTILRL